MLVLFVAARAHSRVVEGLAIARPGVGELLLEFLGAGAQRGIGKGFMLLVQRVDLRNARLIALDAALVGTAQWLAGERVGDPGNPCAGGLTAKLADFNRGRTPAARLC